MAQQLNLWGNSAAAVFAFVAAVFWFMAAKAKIPRLSFKIKDLGKEQEERFEVAFRRVAFWNKWGAGMACLAAIAAGTASAANLFM
jgi:hypothetical protein